MLFDKGQHVGVSAIFVWIFIVGGSLIQRVYFNRHLEYVFQGFDLMLFGKGQHIGVSAIFVWIFIVMRQSIPESLV